MESDDELEEEQAEDTLMHQPVIDERVSVSNPPGNSCCVATTTTTVIHRESMPAEGTVCTRNSHDIAAIQQQQQLQQSGRIPAQPPPPLQDDCHHDESSCCGGHHHRHCRCGCLGHQQQRRLGQPSNTCLLATAFTTFLSFAICQMVFSVVAGSQALLGDSSAMFIDCVSYLLNWLAERRKEQLVSNQKRNKQANEPVAAMQDKENDRDQDISAEDIEPGSIVTTTAVNVAAESYQRDEERALRQAFLQLEIITPLFSISALVGITSWILHDAILTFLSPASPSSPSSASEPETDPRSSPSGPNLNVMIIFSSINLLLDILNMSCFARAKHLLGYKTTSGTRQHLDHHHRHHHSHETNAAEITTAVDNIVVLLEDGVASNAKEDPNDHIANDSDDDSANLNMCAAYTHVFADTQRSLAVILAVIIAKVVQGVTPEMADATAAIVVSLLILLSLIPLMQGLWQTMVEWRVLRAEERAEVAARNSGVCVATAAATGTHPQSKKETESV